ncbi:hypothetical protein FRC08_011417, partial [Ceratobasidium sp. 394]
VHFASSPVVLFAPHFMIPGSAAAIISLLLVTIETRSDLDKVEAWTVIYGLDREFGSYDMVWAGPVSLILFSNSGKQDLPTILGNDISIS